MRQRGEKAGWGLHPWMTIKDTAGIIAKTIFLARPCLNMKAMEPTSGQTEDSRLMTGVVPTIREHIVSTPDTCDSNPRIAGSRIRVKDVVI